MRTNDLDHDNELTAEQQAALDALLENAAGTEDEPLPEWMTVGLEVAEVPPDQGN